MGFEVEGGGIHAIAQAGGRGAVFKHVAEMRATFRAAGFGADHSVSGIAMFLDFGGIGGLIEAGPAGSGFEFG